MSSTTLVTQVDCGNGTVYTVTTTQQPGESDADFAARHAAAVARAQAACDN